MIKCTESSGLLAQDLDLEELIGRRRVGDARQQRVDEVSSISSQQTDVIARLVLQIARRAVRAQLALERDAARALVLQIAPRQQPTRQYLASVQLAQRLA